MGIDETITNLSTTFTNVVLVVAGLVAVVFILVQVWQSKGALGAIVSVGIAAGVFLWIINAVNSGEVQEQIGNTVVGFSVTQERALELSWVSARPHGWAAELEGAVL